MKKLSYIQSFLAILLAFWMLLITNGVLINHHYSHGKLYSSAIYLPADKCCYDMEWDASDGDAHACACQMEEKNRPTCTLSEPHNHDGSCCDESSNWYQLDEDYHFSEPSDIPVVAEISGIFSLLMDSDGNRMEQASFPDISPPIHSPPIFILFSTLLC